MIQVEATTTAQPLDFLIRKEGVGITGLTPTVALRRVSDGFYLDWADSTFKGSGWTTKLGALSEIGGGLYERIVNISALSLAAGVRLSAEYKAVVNGVTVVGQDSLLIVTLLTDAHTGAVAASTAASAAGAAAVAATLSRKFATNRLEAAPGDPGTLVLYDDDGTTPLLTFQLRDATGGAVTSTAGSPALRSAGA